LQLQKILLVNVILFVFLSPPCGGSRPQPARTEGERRQPTDSTSIQFCLRVREDRMCDDDNISELVPAAGSELHEAVRLQDVTAVERLLSQGADPDEPDWAGSGDAPLLHAAAAGSVQVVRCIVVSFGWGGVDINPL
jgi:hypothetical protein